MIIYPDERSHVYDSSVCPIFPQYTCISDNLSITLTLHFTHLKKKDTTWFPADFSEWDIIVHTKCNKTLSFPQARPTWEQISHIVIDAYFICIYHNPVIKISPKTDIKSGNIYIILLSWSPPLMSFNFPSIPFCKLLFTKRKKKITKQFVLPFFYTFLLIMQ